MDNGAFWTRFFQSPANLGLAVGTIINTGGVSDVFRYQVYDVILGSNSSPPKDGAILWKFQRCTGSGSGGTIPAFGKLEPPFTIGGSSTQLLTNITGSNPTFNETLLTIACYAKCTFRWCAVRGSEMIIPASASVGIALSAPINTALATLETTLHFR